MRIQTNIDSLNAYRNLNQTNRSMSQSMERLSSGFRINRASDDAAGLAISEKMRGQVRGLDQAVRNAQDGISLIQTAEGALNETHAILQEMRELANQAANDTLTEDDRSAIQQDIDQLATEISRIGRTTEFNTAELLDGTFTGTLHIGANEGQNMDIEIGDMRAETLGIAASEGIEIEVDATVSHGDWDDDSAKVAWDVEADQAFDVVEFDETIENVGETSVEGFGDGIDANYGLEDGDGNIVAVSDDGVEFQALADATGEDDLDSDTEVAHWDDSGTDTAFDAFDFGDELAVGSEVEFAELDGDDLTATGDHNIEFQDADLASGTYTVVDGDHNLVGDEHHGLVNSQDELVAYSEDGEAWETMGGEELFTVDEDNAFTTPGEELEVTGEGGIDVSSHSAANSALPDLDEAIDLVSLQRSEMGAIQNRLDHTITNLEVASENLTAAESRIRDVDMAAEMTEFTKDQVLTEAGTAMLAQANMAPQSVLQLLG